MNKICIICNKDFIPARKDRTTCSDECYKERLKRYKALHYQKNRDTIRQQHRQYRLRPEVRKTIMTHMRKRLDANSKVHNVVCAQCGKTFQTWRHNQLSCSKECRKIALIRPVKIFYANCVCCGTIFIAKKYNQITCSKECKNKYLYTYRKNHPSNDFKRQYMSRYLKEYRVKNKERLNRLSIKHCHKRRALKAQRTIGEINLDWIDERDGGVCQLCYKPISPLLKHPHPMSKTYDHIITLNDKGEHSNRNLQLAHKICNETKNRNTPNGAQMFLL